jgi:hypothetical protein
MIIPGIIIGYICQNRIFDSVEIVSGETNSFAAGVITTLTSAPTLINNRTRTAAL